MERDATSRGQRLLANCGCVAPGAGVVECLFIAVAGSEVGSRSGKDELGPLQEQFISCWAPVEAISGRGPCQAGRAPGREAAGGIPLSELIWHHHLVKRVRK